MKKIKIAALMLACILLLGGCNRATNKGFYLYRSSPIGFRMEYPSSWTKQVDLEKRIAAFVTPQEGLADGYRENISVSYEEMGEKNFEDFFSAYYGSLPSSFAGFTEESREEILLDEKNAYKIVFSSSQTTKDKNGKEATAKLRILQYIVEVNERAYFVTFIGQPSSYEYFLPYINTMVETLSFTV